MSRPYCKHAVIHSSPPKCCHIVGFAIPQPSWCCSRRLVGTCGAGNWSQIAWQFAGRIGKQCRERWHNQLCPNIKRDAWTNEEEDLLIAAHRGLGNRWVAKPVQPAESTMLLPGRMLEARTPPLVVVWRVPSSATGNLALLRMSTELLPVWPCGQACAVQPACPVKPGLLGPFCWPASAQHSQAPFVSPHMAQVGTETRISCRWVDISKHLPGRTENSVKNHWNATLRRTSKSASSHLFSLKEYMTEINLQYGKVCCSCSFMDLCRA